MFIASTWKFAPMVPKAVDIFVARIKGPEQKVIEAELTELGDAKIAHVILDDLTADPAVRTVAYAVPGPHEGAVLLFSCKLADFEHYSPIFAASLKATRGIAPHPVADSEPSRLAALCLVVILVMLAIWYYRKKRYPH